MNTHDLYEISKLVREDILRMSNKSGSAHIAPALSCADIIVALYFHLMNKDDRFILSKGHGCMSYYSVLSRKGLIPVEWLQTYSENGGMLAEHPSSNIPGVSVCSGSLGHGLSISVGAALARKIQNNNGVEYVLMGDGECNEGSVWEAAMYASHAGLNNLVAFIDKNNFQATNLCLNVINTKTSMAEKWRSFGWHVLEIDGHDYGQLINIKNSSQSPLIVIANTIKGKGISFMENDLEWHYKSPNNKELELAIKELYHA